MLTFYVVLFTNTFLVYLARLFSNKNNPNLGLIKPNFFLFGVVTIIFIIFSGLRHNTGLDTWMYRYSYDLAVMGMEPGYELGFSKLIKILINFSEDSQIFIFTTAAVTNLLIMLGVKRYASYYELSIFLFVTGGYYLLSMNAIRQTFTAAIFFYFGIKYLVEKKMIAYFLVIFIAGYFHNSAKMLYPIYFLAIEKPWSSKIWIFIGISIIGVLGFNDLKEVGEALSGRYSDYITSFDEGGANFFRVMIDVVPVVLAFMRRDVLAEKWKGSGVFVNISLLNLIFMLFSLHNWIFARFSVYLCLSNLILLPYILKNCMNKSLGKTIYASCIIAYLIFFYMETTYFGNTVYRSLILGIY